MMDSIAAATVLTDLQGKMHYQSANYFKKCTI